VEYGLDSKCRTESRRSISGNVEAEGEIPQLSIEPNKRSYDKVINVWAKSDDPNATQNASQILQVMWRRCTRVATSLLLPTPWPIVRWLMQFAG